MAYIPGFFALRIQREILKRDMTLWELSVQLDYCYETVRKVLNREMLPTEELVKRIAKLFEVELAQLRLRVERDQVFHKNGEVTWQLVGLPPRLGPLAVIWEYLDSSDQEEIVAIAELKVRMSEQRRSESA